jgi:molybdate transport system substrate-binding protein
MILFARRTLLAVALIASACAGFPPAASAQSSATPIVFAAASMKTALDAISAAWTAQTGTSPSIVYGSSAVLAKQIEQGAPADVFISADTNWMDYLDKAKLIRPGTRRNLLGNALVLVEPGDSSVALDIAPGFDLAGATGDGKIAVCTIASCPGGVYAKQSLEKLGVWDNVSPKLAQADNIRAALNLVARGEAKFGIVYATDAKAEPKVKVVGTFPEATHAPIVYPVAVLADSKHPEAESFVAFLSSQAATKILVDQGFTVLSK